MSEMKGLCHQGESKGGRHVGALSSTSGSTGTYYHSSFSLTQLRASPLLPWTILSGGKRESESDQKPSFEKT